MTNQAHIAHGSHLPCDAAEAGCSFPGQSAHGKAGVSVPHKQQATVQADAPARSPLRTISDMLADMGIIRIAGNYLDGKWRYRLTFYTEARGVFYGEGSGKTLGDAYQDAIADSKTIRK